MISSARDFISALQRIGLWFGPPAGINQPKISALSNYRFEGFSVERLMHLLNALDQDIGL
jgi:hypothetical protein